MLSPRTDKRIYAGGASCSIVSAALAGSLTNLIIPVKITVQSDAGSITSYDNLNGITIKQAKLQNIIVNDVNVSTDGEKLANNSYNVNTDKAAEEVSFTNLQFI